ARQFRLRAKAKAAPFEWHRFAPSQLSTAIRRAEQCLKRRKQFSFDRTFSTSRFVLCPLPFVLRAELAQKGHHRAPVGEGRLNQVERHESGEQKPVGAEEITEQHCEQDEKARDQSQITFDGHWRNRPPCCS